MNVPTAPQRQKKQTIEQSSVLQLKCLKTHPKSLHIQYDFKLQQNQKKELTTFQTNLIPILNKDKLHFSPLFLLEIDKNEYQQNLDAYQFWFKKKISTTDIEKQEMYVPKPSSDYSFCGICKQQFTDYLSHYNTPVHRQQMRKSQFYKQIFEICTNFSLSKQLLAKSKSKKSLIKTKVIKKVIKNEQKGIKNDQKGIKNEQKGIKKQQLQQKQVRTAIKQAQPIISQDQIII